MGARRALTRWKRQTTDQAGCGDSGLTVGGSLDDRAYRFMVMLWRKTKQLDATIHCHSEPAGEEPGRVTHKYACVTPGTIRVHQRRLSHPVLPGGIGL